MDPWLFFGITVGTSLVVVVTMNGSLTFQPCANQENCSPQHGAGFTVVDNIRQVAHRYGSVKLFKAYLELAEQNSAKSLQLRSELQSCGVSLTDCPHNGRKDVADKMMIGVQSAQYFSCSRINLPSSLC